MGSVVWRGDTLYTGCQVRIGDKEVELDSRVDSSQLPTFVETFQPRDVDNGISQPSCPPMHLPGDMAIERDRTSITPSTTFIAPALFYGTGKAKPKGPLYGLYLPASACLLIISVVRHDPAAEDAVVMKAPTNDHIKKFNQR